MSGRQAVGDMLAVEPPLLVAEDLTKSFGASVAIEDISIEVDRKEILAVLGPSGSGKSTLLLCLAGIIPPDFGSVSFMGQRLDRITEGERSMLRREQFGFVFQFGRLVPELTAVDNVALPLLLSGKKRRDSEREALAWLSRLNVGDVRNKRPGEMSGGQAQRVAVARALVSNPTVVFADEPTGALDSLNGELVLNFLVTTAREQGAAVILVTHEARVAAYADRQVVVRDGKLMKKSVPG